MSAAASTETRYAVGLVAIAAAALLGPTGCASSGGDADTDPDGDAVAETTQPDDADVDADTDSQLTLDADAQDPSCHYDCFGGFSCEDGAYLENVYSPVPCYISDEYGSDVCSALGSTTACAEDTCSDGMCAEDAAWFHDARPDGVGHVAGTFEHSSVSYSSDAPKVTLETSDGAVAVAVTGEAEHVSGVAVRPEGTTAIHTWSIVAEGASLTLDGVDVAHDGLELSLARSPDDGEAGRDYYASWGTALVNVDGAPSVLVLWWTEGHAAWHARMLHGATNVRVAVVEL